MVRNQIEPQKIEFILSILSYKYFRRKQILKLKVKSAIEQLGVGDLTL